MVKKIIILLLIINCFNCSDYSKKEQKIIGNWSYVSEDSLYYEIKIDSEFIQYYNYDAGFLATKDYIFKEDSIVIGYNSNNYSDDSVFSFDYIDYDNILLKNKFEVEMQFYRIISEELTFDKVLDISSEEDMLRFEVAHLNRKNKLFGIEFTYNYDSINQAFKKMKSQKTIVVPKQLESED